MTLIVLAACRAAPGGYPPVETPCQFNRIHAVRVTGAAASAVPQLAVLEGTLEDPGRTARVGALATSALRARGYAQAKLSIERRPVCGVELDVQVALGPRYRIAEIAFVSSRRRPRAEEPPSLTDDDLPGSTLRAALEDALGTVNALGGVYIEYRMKRALAELERRYRDAGWLEVRFGEPRATYDPRGTVAIEIPVDLEAIVEGRR
ncbi:MAG TPA: hypothetical protein VFT22_18990 [Kofleriaceae bacterium]|nr:hypothetical protein [Kofleriaceae bacterium]